MPSNKAIISTFTALVIYSYISKMVAARTYIANGEYKKIKEFPYCAFLLVEQGDQMYGCGSSILNQNFVVTAAHCLTFVKAQDFVSILVGNEVYHKGTSYDIEQFKLHGKHNGFVNDIAVARTNDEIKFSAFVARISIIKHPPNNTRGIVAGWGLVNVHPDIPTEQLTSAEQRIWTRRECLKVVKNLPKGVFCAGEKNGLQHAAPGDSGSALIIMSSQRLHIQLGIVSWAQPEGMVSYTYVPHFYHWIAKTMKALSC